MRSVVYASLLLVPVLLFGSASAAGALSCVRPPENVAEITITGDTQPEGWYREAQTPVVIGLVTKGTPVSRQELNLGDRLALIEVIAGLRLDEVPAQVEIIAGGPDGWGFPTYAEGVYVFVRIEAETDINSGIPAGPCSWRQRYTEAEINDLLALAETHAVPIVLPVVEEAPVEDIESAAAPASPTPGPPTPNADFAISTSLLVALGITGFGGMAAGGYLMNNRRSR